MIAGYLGMLPLLQSLAAEPAYPDAPVAAAAGPTSQPVRVLAPETSKSQTVSLAADTKPTKQKAKARKKNAAKAAKRTTPKSSPASTNVQTHTSTHANQSGSSGGSGGGAVGLGGGSDDSPASSGSGGSCSGLDC
jgi:hypothetical protein